MRNFPSPNCVGDNVIAAVGIGYVHGAARASSAAVDGKLRILIDEQMTI
jgi:hypothetical protein